MQNKLEAGEELNPDLPAEQEAINKQRIVRISDRPVYHIIIDHMFGEKAAAEMLDHVVSLKDKFNDAALHNRQYPDKAVVVKSFRNNQTCFIDDIYNRWNLNPISWQNEIDTWPARKQSRADNSPLLKNIDNLFEGYDYMLTEMLNGAPFPFCKLQRFDMWETQISRYGSLQDEEYKSHYTWHHDRLTNEYMGADDRMLSMVYYLCKEPPNFKGGLLVLSNGLIFKGKIVSRNVHNDESNDDAVIAPKHDRLVIFDARTSHCVEDTAMISEGNTNNFEDGRFSVNIWSGRRDFNADIF